MAKKTPGHIDFHLSETWDYLSGSGYTSPENYRALTLDGLPHDIFHVFYYSFIYGGGPVLGIVIIVGLVSLLDEVL